MPRKPELQKQKTKTQKASKNKFEKSGNSESRIDPDNTSEFGGLPLQDLKKNLGCGG